MNGKDWAEEDRYDPVWKIALMHPLKNLTSFKCSIEEVEYSKDTFGEGIGIY